MYSFFSIIEIFIDTLLYWIPFYFAFKLAFLLWLMVPQTKGAIMIYNHFLKSFLKNNETKIDDAINRARRSASGAVGAAGAVGKAGLEAATKLHASKSD